MLTSKPGEPPKVLTIAGSDSGGAAGLQADLKTFTALGAYGMSVITAVTAQSSIRVEGVFTIPADFVISQLDAVLSDYGAVSIKTGFLGHVEIIQALAEKLASYKANAKKSVLLVVDPVLVNHKGESMFPATVARAYIDHLLPLADLFTPNLAEARLFSDSPVTSLATMEAAARAIQTLGPRWVLIKGARSGQEMVDLLYDGKNGRLLRKPHINSDNTHGSGDTLSAAICVFLARGLSMIEAVKRARDFTTMAIQGATHWRLGSGHGPLSHFEDFP